MLLGILDACPVNHALPARESLLLTVSLVERAEALGYSRYWIAEHHGPDVAHSAPEVLLPVLAGVSDRIRVGVAGVLLRNHNPLRVAQAFRLVEALYPGRIDLGVGAGHAPPAMAAALGALPRDAPDAGSDYEDRLERLVGHMSGRSPFPVPPALVRAPQLWLLGSSGPRAARLAARHGTCLSYSMFIGSGPCDPGLFSQYRGWFREAWPDREPICSVAIAGICAASDEEATSLLAARPPNGIKPSVVGDPVKVRSALRSILEAFNPDELVFMDLAESPEHRLRTLELLAEAADFARPHPRAAKPGQLATLQGEAS